MSRWFSMIGLAILAASCSSVPAGPHEGQKAPSFEGSLMRGGPVQLERFRGKPSMLVFWASWCGPCRQEAPQVAGVARQYGESINLVGINAGEPISVAKRAAGEMAIDWPVVMDLDGRIQSLYKVSGIPLVLILDAEGVVRHRNNGVPSDVHRLLDGLMK